MLIEIKNAELAGRSFCELDHSKFRENLGQLLVGEGYLKGMNLFKEGRFKRIHFDLLDRQDSGSRYLGLSSLKLLSKPGRRLYFSVREEDRLLKSGRRRVILSTARGLMTIGEAKQRQLGGEAICEFS